MELTKAKTCSVCYRGHKSVHASVSKRATIKFESKHRVTHVRLRPSKKADALTVWTLRRCHPTQNEFAANSQAGPYSPYRVTATFFCVCWLLCNPIESPARAAAISHPAVTTIKSKVLGIQSIEASETSCAAQISTRKRSQQPSKSFFVPDFPNLPEAVRQRPKQ